MNARTNLSSLRTAGSTVAWMFMEVPIRECNDSLVMEITNRSSIEKSVQGLVFSEECHYRISPNETFFLHRCLSPLHLFAMRITPVISSVLQLFPFREWITLNYDCHIFHSLLSSRSGPHGFLRRVIYWQCWHFMTALKTEECLKMKVNVEIRTDGLHLKNPLMTMEAPGNRYFNQAVPERTFSFDLLMSCWCFSAPSRWRTKPVQSQSTNGSGLYLPSLSLIESWHLRSAHGDCSISSDYRRRNRWFDGRQYADACWCLRVLVRTFPSLYSDFRRRSWSSTERTDLSGTYRLQGRSNEDYSTVSSLASDRQAWSADQYVEETSWIQRTVRVQYGWCSSIRPRGDLERTGWEGRSSALRPSGEKDRTRCGGCDNHL